MNIYDGKISYAKLGVVGYDNAMYGLTLNFEFDSCSGVSIFIGAFLNNKDALYDAKHKIQNILNQGNVTEYNELVNKNVKLYFNGQVLHDWHLK